MYNLKIELFKHQVTGIERTLQILQSYKGFLNRCEQGTGKTLMTIGAMNSLKAQSLLNKILIICPNSLKYNWEREIKQNSEIPWDVLVLSGDTTKRHKQIITTKANVLINNYESMTKLINPLNAFKPDLVICDECHEIKTYNSKKTKAVKAIKTRYKIGMTGTPMTVSPLDYWSPIDWLIPNYLNSTFFGFRNTYANVFTGCGFPKINGYKNLDKLQGKVDQISYRVLKSECLDLPDKIYEVIEFDLEPKERKAYDDMLKHMILEVGEQEIPAANAAVKLGKLLQLTGGTVLSPEGNSIHIGDSKIKIAMEVLEMIGENKAIIFALFKEDITLLYKKITAAKKPALLLTAEQTPEERNEVVKLFQESAEPYTLITSSRIGGVGLNLVAANFVIYFTNSFSIKDRQQSEDRAHRIGQTDKVIYYDLVARKTVDSYVIKSLQQKQSLSDYINGDTLRKIGTGE